MTGHPPLEAFRQAYLLANEAFNRHDFESAFFGFHPELEWHPVCTRRARASCTGETA